MAPTPKHAAFVAAVQDAAEQPLKQDVLLSLVGYNCRRAYLDIMQMRMPDRLRYAVHAPDDVLALRCPPLTLLTLVENAVRHGIDPGEEGGSIEISVRQWDQRCQVSVVDTGVGLQQTGRSDGTGLATLRERLQLAFSGDARLRLTAVEPHGVCAELDFPADRIAP